MKHSFRRAVTVAACMTAGAVTLPRVTEAQTPAAKFVDSSRVELDRAVHDMDTDRIDRTIILLDRALVAFPDDPYLLHYRGYAAYRKATGAFLGGMSERARPDITRGLADLGKSAERLAWPETIQLEASLTGMRIALEPGLGPTLGPLSGRLSGEATKMGPNNPRVLLLQAYAAQTTPESMGGGVERAKTLAAKAIAAFADDHPAPLAPAWGREEALMLQQRLSGSAGHPPR
jgi:hypothetical protein